MPKIGRKEILGSTYLNPILQLIPGILDFLISSTQPVTLISNAEWGIQKDLVIYHHSHASNVLLRG